MHRLFGKDFYKNGAVEQVKPAGNREIIVTLKGIHPITRDDGVMDYLSKF